MDKIFKPRNRVQELALQQRNIMSQPEFERAINVKPWQVARLTARSWWLKGVTDGMRVGYAKTLASFLLVTIDDLVKEDTK